LLAIDPKNGSRYHIEVGINIGSKLPLKNGRQSFNSLLKRKFENVYIINHIHRIFGDKEKYGKILVAWDVRKEVEENAKEHGIEIWRMPLLLWELRGAIFGSPKGSRDDILRTLELFTETEKLVMKEKFGWKRISVLDML
jgi:hypothetical protein